MGGLEESFDTVILEGNPFICLDNLRGKFDSPKIESCLTEDIYRARIPNSRAIAIDPRKTNVFLTSNKAELTPDFANRTSTIRLRKQPIGYKFRSYPEGDLLAHVRACQTEFLAAVYAIVRSGTRPECG